MNLLFLDSIEIDTFGGMEEWIRLVAGGLVKRGHQVTVAGRRGSKFLKRTEEFNSEIDILPLKISGDFDPFTISILRKQIINKRIDLVCTNFNKDIRLGGLASKFSRSPKVVWSAGLDITSSGLTHRLLTPWLLDGVIVPSASLKKQITRRGYIRPDLVQVIPIGIPSANPSWSSAAARIELRKKYNLSPETLVVVTSGRFVTQKGHKYLIKAASQISAEQPNLRFLFLGEGPLRKELEDQISALGLSEKFIFAGLLDHFELELAGADLMLHPSIGEPFGIVLLEAMRAGLPIIASRVGGIPEVVAEFKTALLVEPADPHSIVKSVLELLSDKPRRELMGETGRKRFEEEFADEVMNDRVEDNFRTLVEGVACR